MSLFIRINRSLGLPIRDVVCICTRNDIVSVSGSFLAIAFRITPPLVSIPADPSTASSSSHMLAYGPLDTKNVVLIDMDCVLLTTYIHKCITRVLLPLISGCTSAKGILEFLSLLWLAIDSAKWTVWVVY